MVVPWPSLVASPSVIAKGEKETEESIRWWNLDSLCCPPQGQAWPEDEHLAVKQEVGWDEEGGGDEIPMEWG